MIEEILAAVAIGGGLGNSWICALLSLGASMEGKKSGLAFIGGRFIGLVILGAVIAALGLVGGFKPTYFLVAIGIMSIALGGWVLYQTLTKQPFGHKKGFFRRLRHPEVMANGGEHELDTRPKTASFFALGMFRGATPCLKVAILAPLLISVDFGLAMLMVLAYAAVSTVYPMIGLLSGNLLRQSEKYTLYVRVAAALIIVILGIFFIRPQGISVPNCFDKLLNVLLFYLPHQCFS